MTTKGRKIVGEKMENAEDILTNTPYRRLTIHKYPSGWRIECITEDDLWFEVVSSDSIGEALARVQLRAEKRLFPKEEDGDIPDSD